MGPRSKGKKRDYRKLLAPIVGLITVPLAVLTVANVTMGAFTTSTNNTFDLAATTPEAFKQVLVTDSSGATPVGDFVISTPSGIDTNMFEPAFPKFFPNSQGETVFVKIYDPQSFSGFRIEALGVQVLDAQGNQVPEGPARDTALDSMSLDMVLHTDAETTLSPFSGTLYDLVQAPFTVKSVGDTTGYPFPPSRSFVIEVDSSVPLDLPQSTTGWSIVADIHVISDPDVPEPVPAQPSTFTLEANNLGDMTIFGEGFDALTDTVQVSYDDGATFDTIVPDPASLSVSAESVRLSAASEPEVAAAAGGSFTINLSGLETGSSQEVSIRVCSDEFGTCSAWMKKTIAVPTDAEACEPNTASGANCTDTKPATAVQETVYSCPSGGSLSGTTCQKFDTVFVGYSCPSGGTLVGSQCETSYTYTTYSCPSGGSLSGTTCTVTTSSPTCPSGGYFDSSRGDCVNPTEVWQCPDGWSRVTDSTCQRSYTATGFWQGQCSVIRANLGNPPGWSASYSNGWCSYSYTAYETANNATRVTRLNPYPATYVNSTSTYNATAGSATGYDYTQATANYGTQDNSYSATGTEVTNYNCNSRPSYVLSGTNCNLSYPVPVITRTA